MKRIMIVLTVSGMLVATSVWAGSLTVPNTFDGGQKALASEVNENFDEVETQVTDNADNISSNASSITDIKGQLPNINALTLEGRPASDFADSNHPHDEIGYLSGVYRISPRIFDSGDDNYGAQATALEFGYSCGNACSQGSGYAPLVLPFNCLIDRVEFHVNDPTRSGYTEVSLVKHTQETDGSWTPTVIGVDSTGMTETPGWLNLSFSANETYDPADDYLYSFDVKFISSPTDPYRQEGVELQRLSWIKIYYSIPQ